ncbi:hypothetical protein HG536_0A03290 [Torulaspora globosa]|uniref:Uncharacterized protein n=1 Tax=Torulaspora globosa TaxID=48254 RepID=A0A7G3ZAH5_9SACH|nr:uncharacterized protein HG536_0A03290 [Torulaspora globosa]QLL30511.1 hypothetical protein HG536_0A03290 [Torulaspora globosa]
MKFQLSLIIIQFVVLAKAVALSGQEGTAGSLYQTQSMPIAVPNETVSVGVLTSIVQATQTESFSSITPSTIYAFSGEPGAASDVLQLPIGSSGLLSLSSSDSVDASSALSQFLNGAGVATSLSVSKTGSLSRSRTDSASFSSTRATTRLAANSSATMTSDGRSSSSTNSISASGGAHRMASPAIAGGMIAGLVAFL